MYCGLWLMIIHPDDPISMHHFTLEIIAGELSIMAHWLHADGSTSIFCLALAIIESELYIMTC